MTTRRVTIYIDGFNLYYGLLKPNPASKWLDLAALGAALRPTDVVLDLVEASGLSVPEDRVSCERTVGHPAAWLGLAGVEIAVVPTINWYVLLGLVVIAAVRLARH